MKKHLAILPALLLTLLPPAPAQVNSSGFPADFAAAKTIAIENDTHVEAVAEGAAEAVRAWGRYKLVDDPDAADVVLRFDKSKDHSGQDSQKPDPATGDPNYSYSMSFSTSIHMKAYMKETATPFYTTRTDESKKKAGLACVSDLRRSAMASRSLP